MAFLQFLMFIDRGQIDRPHPVQPLTNLLELLAQLERRFGFQLKIDDLNIDDLRTLARIARLVANHGAAAAAVARPTVGAAG